jgi:FtsP/CotA-like multicopper oxidase with cupredoxin domain
VVIAHGELFHTFHLHGHRWADTRTGYLSGLDDATPVIDNKTVGPADSFGFQVVAGEGVGPGAWMYHCHVQSHSDSGMTGLFVVRNPDGTMSAQTRRAIKKWKKESHGGHS